LQKLLGLPGILWYCMARSDYVIAAIKPLLTQPVLAVINRRIKTR